MKNKIVVGAFLFMIAAFIVVLSLPSDEESILAENRIMSTMPPFSQETVFTGEFAQGVESFIGDSIGFRSAFTDFSKTLEKSRGIEPKAGTIISTDKDIGTGTTQKQTLLVADDAIMEMFISNPQMSKMYTETINHYAQKLPEGIQLYNMIIPTQLEFSEPIYRNLQDSQQETIDNIYSGLDSRVTPVDAYGELARHKDEYIYFHTDHHWTQLGAYYAYRAFIFAEGGAAVDKDSYEQSSINGVLGSLHEKANSPDAQVTLDQIKWYDINNDRHIRTRMYDMDINGHKTRYNGDMYDRSKTNYTFFFGSDHPMVEMTNENNPDGKTLVVLKESYANVLTPWLIESYRKVVMVDPRIFAGNIQNIIDEYQPDEVLITNYIFTTNFSDYCNLLKSIY